MLDEHNTIHYANGAAASILGGRTDELIGTIFESKTADRETIEAPDRGPVQHAVVRQTEATLPGRPRIRVVILIDETKATTPHEIEAKVQEAAAALASLEGAAEAAVSEPAATPGTEAVAARLRHAVAGSVAVVRGSSPTGSDARNWQDRDSRGPHGFRVRGESTQEPDCATPRRMLVVDDDGAVARITARALAVLGIEAIAQDSVGGALSYLETDSVDTVLVDAMMPGPGIEQVCREIRRLQPGARVVVMSGADTVEDLVRDVSDCFLAKPFSVAELRGLFDERAPQRLKRAA
jgi:CheY-like chemotaxis protein